MGFFGKIFEWMGDHKLATGAIAAGVGYVTLSKAAKAETRNPNLPGTKNVTQLPNGGLATPTHVVPPPHPQAAGPTFYVATHDPAPQGNLNARSTPNLSAQGIPTGQIVGYWPKDGPVELLDPGPGNGMVFVRGPGVDNATNEALTLEGWASSAYLAKKDDITDLLSNFPVRF